MYTDDVAEDGTTYSEWMGDFTDMTYSVCEGDASPSSYMTDVIGCGTLTLDV